MKKTIIYKLCIIGILSLSVLSVTGCSIKGVTEPFDQGGNQVETKPEKETLPTENETESHASSDKNNPETPINNEDRYGKVKYQVGEAMPGLTNRGAKLEDLEEYISITVTGKHIYNSLSEAGIDESECPELCEIYPEFDEIPLTLTTDKYRDAKILVLDAHIEVEEWYLNEKSSEDNITGWHLSYVMDDGTYVHLGYPCYFSKGMPGHVFAMDLREKSFDVKVGYIIDEELLRVDRIDLSRLIYNVYGSGPTFKYMVLFPEG